MPPAQESKTGHPLWPTDDYYRQVRQLQQAVGEPVYLVELKPEAINLGIRYSDTPRELLAVLEFPRPDPEQGLAPHLILLDDGRGINLGRLARISRRTAYSPHADDILYQEHSLMQLLLWRERQLSDRHIQHRSRLLLAQLLGKPLPSALPSGNSR